MRLTVDRRQSRAHSLARPTTKNGVCEYLAGRNPARPKYRYARRDEPSFPFTRGRFLGNAALKATPVGANSTLRFAHMAQQPGPSPSGRHLRHRNWLAGRRDRPIHDPSSTATLTYVLWSSPAFCPTRAFAKHQSTKAPHATHRQ